MLVSVYVINNGNYLPIVSFTSDLQQPFQFDIRQWQDPSSRPDRLSTWIDSYYNLDCLSDIRLWWSVFNTEYIISINWQILGLRFSIWYAAIIITTLRLIVLIVTYMYIVTRNGKIAWKNGPNWSSHSLRLSTMLH